MEDVPTTVRPILDSVLVRRDPPRDKLGSGLLFAIQGEEDWPPIGTVIAVGPGAYLADGTRVPLDVKVGDRVIFKSQPASALIPDSREGGREDWANLVMLDYENIHGLVEEE